MADEPFQETRASHRNTRRVEKGTTWDEYVNKVLLGSGFVSQAAILGLKNGKQWAASPGFYVSPDEAKAVIDGFMEPKDLFKLGIILSGTKYSCINVRPNYIVGSKGKSGCVICRCKQSVIFALYGEEARPGGCLSRVLQLGDYLKDSGL